MSWRAELKSWEGLLIDFEYGTILSCIESKLALMGSEDKLDGLEVTEVQVGRGKRKKGDSGKGDGLNATSSSQTDTQDLIPKASSAHVVCFLYFIAILSLRDLAGHCSFHLNWAAHIRCTVAQKTVQVFACFRKIVLVQNADIIQAPDCLVIKNITYQLSKTF